jgi:anti-anti-sigma factor
MTEASDKSGGFAVSVDFYASHAVLGLRGVLDELALPGLSALLGAVIAGGYDTVTLDLSELDYMTSVGMRVIAEADRQVSDRRGRLTVRSPSAAVRHLLDANGLGQLASSPTREAAAHQGRSGAMPVAAGAAAYGLVHDLRRATAVPSNDDVIDNALRLVLAVARTTVDGADGVSIGLRRHGQLATVAASDQTISHMDASQYATGEGPCVAASVEGRGFLVDSLSSETRWPSFIPLARALGINAILSTPLTADDLPVGSINIYSRTVAAFDAQDRALVSVLAVEASAILTDAGLNLSDQERSARFQDALLTRQVIAQAQGVLMERSGITEDRAFTMLRLHSQRTGLPLHRWAQDITDSTRRPEGRTEPVAPTGDGGPTAGTGTAAGTNGARNESRTGEDGDHG